MQFIQQFYERKIFQDRRQQYVPEKGAVLVKKYSKIEERTEIELNPNKIWFKMKLSAVHMF